MSRCEEKCVQSLTDENKAGCNEVCEQVTSEWFIIFAIAFGKKANKGIEPVLTQALVGKRGKR